MKVLQAISKLITLISIGFVIWVIAKMDFSFWQTINKQQSLVIVIICSIFYAFNFPLLALGWSLLLSGFSSQAKHIQFPLLNWVYAKSNLMKYMPGNFFEFVGRNIFLSKLGVLHKHIALASLVETVITILIPLLFGLVATRDILMLLQKKFQLTENTQIAMVTIAILIAIVVFALLRTRIDLNAFTSTIKTSFSTILKVALLQGIFFINLSLTFLCIYVHVFNMQLGLADYFVILGSVSIAWTLGFVTLGAPGGIGVKEIGLISLLATQYGMEATLVASILHRIISVAGDVLYFAVSYLYLNFSIKRGQIKLPI